MTATVVLHNCDIRRNELKKRIGEEKGLLKNLRQIINKLNMEITNTNT